MKLKAAITRGAPEAVVNALGSSEFARSFLVAVVEDQLGASKSIERPAEYYVQEPDYTVNIEGRFGVELRLTGVSRSNRKAAQFHRAIKKLNELANQTIAKALQASGSGVEVQLFCVLMLDGDVETAPGSGVYSNTLESDAVLVQAKSVE